MSNEELEMDIIGSEVTIPSLVNSINESVSESEDEVEEFLVKLLEALRNLPSHAAKGTSIIKIKEYLKKRFHVRRQEMLKLLKPTLQEAVEKKLVFKTTGRFLMTGSVLLNPNFANKNVKRHESTRTPRNVANFAEENNFEAALGIPVGNSSDQKHRAAKLVNKIPLKRTALKRLA